MNYSQAPTSPVIREHDTCVIYISENIRYILRIEPEAQLQTKFGALKGLDLINHPYGARYELRKGWVLPLRLTPELWTKLLPHRTQILYQTDISMILLQLDIKPGCIVVESGTGSGSLSHSILRACAPRGFLHTFDTNESRVLEVQKEFEAHGFANNVRVQCRNVCQLGFGQDLEGKVDACILDLPQTWDAIEHAERVLKSSGARLCTFSPCIEQVQQNVAKMTQLNFKDIVTLECLLRPFEVKPKELRLWTQEILDGLIGIDKKRIENIQKNLDAKQRDAKQDKPSRECATTEQAEDKDPLSRALADPKVPFSLNMLPKQTHLQAKQFSETVSHSGYLTFASKRF